MREIDRSPSTAPAPERERRSAPLRPPLTEQILQLQRAAGNRATQKVIQRLPEGWKSTREGAARVARLWQDGNVIHARILGAPDHGELKMETQMIEGVEYLTLHEVTSHPPRSGLGALMVLALAKLAAARGQPFIPIDLTAPTALPFYRKMGFRMKEEDLAVYVPYFQLLANTVGADGGLVARVVAVHPALDRLSDEVDDTTPLANLIAQAPDEQSLRAKLAGPSLNALDQLLQTMTTPWVVATIPGLDDIPAPFGRLQYLAKVKKLEYAIGRVGETDAVLAAAQAQVDASWSQTLLPPAPPEQRQEGETPVSSSSSSALGKLSSWLFKK